MYDLSTEYITQEWQNAGSTAKLTAESFKEWLGAQGSISAIRIPCLSLISFQVLSSYLNLFMFYVCSLFSMALSQTWSQ